jgi:hypothetical protein
LEAWPENWENKAVMVAIGTGDFERVVQPQYVRMSTVGVCCAEMLEDPQFIVDVDVGDEDFEREVGGHVSTRTDKPDGRKPSVAKLVDDFVALIAGADHVADVDGVGRYFSTSSTRSMRGWRYRKGGNGSIDIAKAGRDE